MIERDYFCISLYIVLWEIPAYYTFNIGFYVDVNASGGGFAAMFPAVSAVLVAKWEIL